MLSTLSHLVWGDPMKDAQVVVTKLLVHPIKSCKGISVQESRYDINGLEFDRRFMVVEAESHKFVSARESPTLVMIASAIRGYELVISFPEGSGRPTFHVPLSATRQEVASWERLADVKLWKDTLDGYVVQFSSTSPYKETSPSQVISDFLEKPVLLVFQGEPHPVDSTDTHPDLHETSTAIFHDSYPILIASNESLKKAQESVLHAANGDEGWKGLGGLDANKWKNDQLVMERFRPNIVVSGVHAGFDEDSWKEIKIGDEEDATISCVSRCTRCNLPNVDPNSGEVDKAVPYKVLAKFRRVDPGHPYTPCFGVNACPNESGIVRVGDKVRVLAWVERESLAIK